jgi:V-type H+-transporting ATPase subunit D
VGVLQGELDELEREEFFRLKKVQDKKQRDLDKRKAAAALKMSATQGMNGNTHSAPGNMLVTDDQDELF